MSHDLYATWACAEIAKIISNDQPTYFSASQLTNGWTIAAGREGGRLWPLADGVISSYHSSTNSDMNIAVEFKRINEGLHGTLTALGQSLAYLHKGYNASIIVIPDKYPSYSTPALHIKEILDLTANNMPVGVFSYEDPDLSKLRPFEKKIKCHRLPNLSLSPLVSNTSISSRPRSSTLWAHVREGMSYPDVFYKYCKQVKFVTSQMLNKNYALPQEIINAVQRVKPNADPYKFLSYTSNDSVLDRAWLHFWFEYYFHQKLIPIFKKKQVGSKIVYEVNEVSTLIFQKQGKYANFLSGRVDSPKNKLVAQLNLGAITENEAWDLYVKNVNSLAHSYREVIDSGLYHLNLLDNDGKLTNIGYRFVDEADKENSVYASTSMQILRGTTLIYGNFMAFLHYVYQISEEIFIANNLAFTSNTNGKKISFDSNQYKEYLYKKMKDELSLILTSSIRSPGNPRKAFQAEVPFLKYLGIISEEHSPFRIGAGLLINWPIVQESIEFMNKNNL